MRSVFTQEAPTDSHAVSSSISDMITKVVRPLLDEIFFLASRSPILAYKKIDALLQHYQTGSTDEKAAILEHIATNYHPDERAVSAQAQQLSSTNFVKDCARLHASTTPKYAELFRLIGRQPDGVRSLVHLRSDLLQLLPEMGTSRICATLTSGSFQTRVIMPNE